MDRLGSSGGTLEESTGQKCTPTGPCPSTSSLSLGGRVGWAKPARQLLSSRHTHPAAELTTRHGQGPSRARSMRATTDPTLGRLPCQIRRRGTSRAAGTPRCSGAAKGTRHASKGRRSIADQHTHTQKSGKVTKLLSQGQRSLLRVHYSKKPLGADTTRRRKQKRGGPYWPASDSSSMAAGSLTTPAKGSPPDSGTNVATTSAARLRTWPRASAS